MEYKDDTERVVALYGTSVYRVCCMKLASTDRTLADDAYQNTFLYYIEHPPKIEPGTQHEKAWFIRCAICRCIDLLRVHNTYEEINDTFQASSEDTTEVMSALLSLPDKYRMPLYLTAVMGYSIAETAKILGITSAGLRMRLTRARRKLAKELNFEAYLIKPLKENSNETY